MVSCLASFTVQAGGRIIYSKNNCKLVSSWRLSQLVIAISTRYPKIAKLFITSRKGEEAVLKNYRQDPTKITAHSVYLGVASPATE